MRLSNDQRGTALKRLGYELYTHDGKVANAPRQIRHLLRDVPAGVYPVNYALNRVAGERLAGAKSDRMLQAYLQAAKDVLNREGWSFSQILERGYFVHFDGNDVTVERTLQNMPDGYYAVKGKHFMGPYQHAIDLVDDMINETFPKVLKGLAVEEPVAQDDFMFTEFNDDNGGVITLGPVDSGTVIAFIPKSPVSRQFARTATLSPVMFDIIYQLSIASSLNSRNLQGLQNMAIEIVGHINS